MSGHGENGSNEERDYRVPLKAGIVLLAMVIAMIFIATL